MINSFADFFITLFTRFNSSMLDSIFSFFTWFRDWLNWLWSSLWSSITTFWSWLCDIWVNLFNWLTNVLSDLWGWFSDAFSGMLDSLLPSESTIETIYTYWGVISHWYNFVENWFPLTYFFILVFAYFAFLGVMISVKLIIKLFVPFVG